MAEFRDVAVGEIADRYIEGTPEVSEVPVMPDGIKSSKITGSNTEDKTINEGTVYFDIRFCAVTPRSGESIRLILNIEAQNDFYPGYSLVTRAIYYCSRMISSQYGTEFTDSHYENIKKVYSIWICMNPPKERQNSISSYSIKEKNLISNVKEAVEHYDLMTAVMICTGSENNENYSGILKLLGVLFSNELSQDEKLKVLQEDFDIPMTHSIERGISSMCSLSDSVWQRAMEKGLAEGREKGLTEGMEKGMEKGITEGAEKNLIENIRSLMVTMKMTAEQAMAALRIPESKWAGYNAKL
ncbi:MAG: PD-(D/E)XK nuclease family transposase [Lachnospiraceae bacterium]|nr:PD-(D/E)XK nuclease family transposase [Lachnospiraceae bacterium]